jgi:hypothetical protein
VHKVAELSGHCQTIGFEWFTAPHRSVSAEFDAAMVVEECSRRASPRWKYVGGASYWSVTCNNKARVRIIFRLGKLKKPKLTGTGSDPSAPAYSCPRCAGEGEKKPVKPHPFC